MTRSNVDYKDHGGECCGIIHIFEFSPYPKEAQRDHLEEVDDILKSYRSYLYRDRGLGEDPKGTLSGKLFEIVLTDDQIESMPVLVAGLKKRGFKLVSRFRNSTGGWCNVLHKRPQNATRSSPWHK